MPVQQGTLNVVDDAVFEVVSLPASAFSGVDDDGDGRLSDAEVARHEASLRDVLSRRYRLFDGDAPGQLELVLVRAEQDERSADSTVGAPCLVALLKTRFPVAPRALRLETDLFGAERATQQLTVKVTRGGEVELAVLTPRLPTHRFFRGALLALGDAVLTGVEHILLGLDHLCFLLTLVVAATGWRAWLAMLTSFTIAHSLTLLLALSGLVQVPAWLVEPAIAASIVCMAVMNLRSGRQRSKPRVVLVFACGLLHGLGFASALSALGLHGTHRALELLGFNVGIELGQGAFVLVVLALGFVGARVTARWAQVARVPALGSVASVSALGLGAFWFVQRVAGAF
jgi:hydrogenase/urease accessory protein HupE